MERLLQVSPRIKATLSQWGDLEFNWVNESPDFYYSDSEESDSITKEDAAKLILLLQEFIKL